MPLCASVYMCPVVNCWERDDLFALVCGVEMWICHFPIGVLGQVLYLIVSIPDLCTLTYFIFFSWSGLLACRSSNNAWCSWDWPYGKGVWRRVSPSFEYRPRAELWVPPGLPWVSIIRFHQDFVRIGYIKKYGWHQESWLTTWCQMVILRNVLFNPVLTWLMDSFLCSPLSTEFDIIKQAQRISWKRSNVIWLDDVIVY